jgi:hypothetical protein
VTFAVAVFGLESFSLRRSESLCFLNWKSVLLFYQKVTRVTFRDCIEDILMVSFFIADLES